MLVVSDTSPLNYLILVDAVTVLPVIFKEVCIPPAVLTELSDLRGPVQVRDWAANPPAWLMVRAARHIDAIHGLHLGETEAIALAEELRAEALLVDEREATLVATQRGIRVVGTLGVLSTAVAAGLLDAHQIADRLHRTNFRAPRELIDDIIFSSLKSHPSRK